VCEWIKSKKMVGTVDTLTVETFNLLSITLTRPPSTACLERQVKDLIEAFKRLRTLAPWKNSIFGGVRCIHAPYDAIAQSWHPHIHVLAEGWTTEAKEIEYRWLQITGGYAQVKVIDGEEHRRHMAWYVSKSPNEDLKDQPERLAEFLKVRKRFRSKQTLGNLYGNPLYPTRRKKSRNGAKQ